MKIRKGNINPVGRQIYISLITCFWIPLNIVSIYIWIIVYWNVMKYILFRLNPVGRAYKLWTKKGNKNYEKWISLCHNEAYYSFKEKAVHILKLVVSSMSKSTYSIVFHKHSKTSTLCLIYIQISSATQLWGLPKKLCASI